MIKSHHKKIAIIGCAGSGKTTLSLQLKEKLNLPLYHLDQYYWKPGWQRSDLASFGEAHHELCEREEWIIDGPFMNVIFYRIMHADVVIFLDVPRSFCLWRVIKRASFNLGKVAPGSSEGCEQRLLSPTFLELLKWIWNFDKRYRRMILNILDDFQDEKEIHVLKSQKEIDAFMASM